MSDWRSLETFSFGDGPELADELLALVLSGRKTATCWAASQGLLTEIGKRMVAPVVHAHRVYFTRLGQFAEDMELWCERFRVAEVILAAPG